MKIICILTWFLCVACVPTNKQPTEKREGRYDVQSYIGVAISDSQLATHRVSRYHAEISCTTVFRLVGTDNVYTHVQSTKVSRTQRVPVEINLKRYRTGDQVRITFYYNLKGDNPEEPTVAIQEL